MRREPLRAEKSQTRRVRPVLEGLEARQLLSHGSLRHPVAMAVSSSGGLFSANDRQFTYTTPTGGTAVIQVLGRGNLSGTSLDASGDLRLEYDGTNAFSRIVGQVQGGDGRAPIVSIFGNPASDPGSKKRLSGVGSKVVEAVLLGDFDLIAGGTINLTAGVNSLVLDSVGPGTQINLRTLPASLQVSSSSSTSSSSSSGSGASSSADPSSSSTSSSTAPSNFTAGTTTTVTNADNTTWTYITDHNLGLTLSNVSGNFAQAGNIVEPLAQGQPLSIPPAPPGIIFKVNEIGGASPTPINLLTDSDIFGYDPVTGQVIRFNLNLTTDTGTQDPTFAPINVPGDPQVAGLNLGWNGDQLDVLVSSGENVYAYNATTGAPDGSFNAGTPIISIGLADSVTVLGTSSSQLEMINLPASLSSPTGMVVLLAGPFMPAPGFTLLGGLTGVPASNTIYATVAAHFNTFQPNQFQLGIQSVSTVQVQSTPQVGTSLSFQFTAGTATAFQQQGLYTPVQPVPPGPALGSVDHNLALDAGLSKDKTSTIIDLYAPGTLSSTGTITLYYTDPLEALSANFRPDITTTGAALVDIQGNVQSIRGGTATGLVLNDTGNLNLVKFQSVANSTIVGQPVGHIQIARRSNVTILTPVRRVDGRNGVTVDPSLQQIGPLAQTGD